MDYIVLNLTPILLATLAGLLVGAVHVWLSRSVARPGPGLIMLSAGAEFWLACILAGALILAPPLGDPWVIAIATAVIIWIGFMLPSLLVSLRLRGLPGSAALAECMHWLVVMLAQTIVMQTIGLVKPPGA